MKYYYFILFFFIAIEVSGQDYILFRLSFKNLHYFETENDEILDTAYGQLVSKKELDKYNYDNYVNSAARYSRNKSFLEVLAVYYNNLPSFICDKEQKIPEYPCKVFDLLDTAQEAFVFSLNTSGKMKTLDSFQNDYESSTFKYRNFIAKEGKLYVKNKKYYEKVFDRNLAFETITSFLGESIFVKHYAEIEFLSKKFLDIYEYFCHYRNKSGEEVWMLLWFDKDYNLQRILLTEWGYFRM